MVRNFLLCILVVSALLNVVAIANSYDEGKEFANSELGNLSNIAKDDSIKQEVPSYSDNPIEATLSDAQIRERSENLKFGGNEAYDYIKESKKIKDEKFSLDMKFQEETWFKNSLETTRTANDAILKDCKGSGVDVQDTKDEFETYKVPVETIQTIIDKKSCHETLIIESNCEKELKLKCEYNNLCNSGGVVLDSIASDMKWEHKDDHFILGTISDNYWRSECGEYDRVTSFEIKNLDKIHEFKIVEEGFDDYLLIKINGHVIFVGPDGGDRLELSQKTREERHMGLFKQKVYYTVFNGKSEQPCERMISHVLHTEIDLKPYLKNGVNEIFMRTIVGGAGESWIKIRAKQFCCSKWIESWEDNCGEFQE